MYIYNSPVYIRIRKLTQLISTSTFKVKLNIEYIFYEYKSNIIGPDSRTYVWRKANTEMQNLGHDLVL